jgi:hypothetical protein
MFEEVTKERFWSDELGERSGRKGNRYIVDIPEDVRALFDSHEIDPFRTLRSGGFQKYTENAVSKPLI